LCDGQFNGSYGELHRKICESLPDKQQPHRLVFGMPNNDFDLQRPFTI
jgi:hypothetical protein